MSAAPTPEASSPAVRASMVSNRGKDSAPELALRRELHRRGRRFRKHLRPIPGLRCTPDIVFTRARVSVFVDGCFWHRCPLHGTDPARNGAWWAAKLDANVTRDRRHDEALTGAGWRVLRVWEHEDPVAAADRVEALLDEPPFGMESRLSAPRFSAEPTTWQAGWSSAQRSLRSTDA